MIKVPTDINDQTSTGMIVEYVTEPSTQQSTNKHIRPRSQILIESNSKQQKI